MKKAKHRRGVPAWKRKKQLRARLRFQEVYPVNWIAPDSFAARQQCYAIKQVLTQIMVEQSA